MSVALKKADGDLYIDNSGRGVEVSGPTKVDQELFSLYTTVYDPTRNWGSYLQLKFFRNVNSLAELKAYLYNQVSAANSRMLQKQQNDLYLDTQSEKIQKFDRLDVYVDGGTQSGLFITSASVGVAGTPVGQQLFLSFQPLSIRHVLPPLIPAGLLPPESFNT